MGAWQEIARYLAAQNASPVQRLEALIGLLMANPYQPDALATAAHLLAATGNHDRAVDYLNAAIEQLRLASFQIPANNYLEIALELALANRYGEAEPLLANLANLPNAPLTAPVCACWSAAPPPPARRRPPRPVPRRPPRPRC